MKTLVRILSACLAALTVTLAPAFAQRTVRGGVKDAEGQPLPGVTVMVQGTSTGTMTGPDGSWSLSVPEGAVLEFSCMGMTTVTRPYGGESRIDVVLTEDTLYLEDVVVVAGSGRNASV